MGCVMIQFRFPDGAPTRAQAARALGLAPGDLDPQFGVTLIDPAGNLYAVRVDAEAAERAATAVGGDGRQGVFADPEIAPFGLRPR